MSLTATLLNIKSILLIEPEGIEILKDMHHSQL